MTSPRKTPEPSNRLPTSTLSFHPLADLFPLIEGAEFDALVADIAAHGVRESVVTFDGKILDGRNRYRASQAAGVACPVREYDGDNPVAFVVSANLHRRHLNETQRAWVASKIANLADGQRADRVAGSIDLATAAQMLNVSEKSIKRAKAVQRDAEPELQAAVEQGKIAVSLAAAASKLPQDQQREIARRARNGDDRIVKKVVKQNLRAQREQELGGKQCALPNKKYGVIYADPEWKFETFSADGKGSTAAENHYPTSDLEVIKARDVPSMSADDCVLFLCATVPMLLAALYVMEAWGFTYKTHFIWVKDRTGTGYWNLNQHELLLVGTRGDIPCPAPGTQWPSVIEAPRGRHSEKPEKFYELIEAYFPNLPKIELNARRARAGWDSWGFEAPTDMQAPDADDLEIPACLRRARS